MKEWIISFLKLTPIKGDQGIPGPKGDKGDKGDNGESKKINVPLEEINNPALQTANDYFMVFQDRLSPNMHPQYMLGGNVEHSFFTETSTIDEDLNYLRLVVVSPSNKIVKQLSKDEIKKIIIGKRLVPGAKYWSLDLQMTKSFMDIHLTNLEDKIVMMFVGDKREFISTEVDAVEYLLFKVNKLEIELKKLDRYRF